MPDRRAPKSRRALTRTGIKAGKLTKFGYFAVGSFRQALHPASHSAGLDYSVSPYDFGTERAPAIKEV